MADRRVEIHTGSFTSTDLLTGTSTHSEIHFWREDGRLWFGVADKWDTPLGEVSVRYEVDEATLYPLYRSHWTRFAGPLGPCDYLKEPDYDAFTESEEVRVADPPPVPKLHADEIEIMELLAKHPHPHIVIYKGVLVDEASGRVRGIVLERCTGNEGRNLMCATAPPAGERLIREIGSALAHVHSLGYAHNDVSDNNIVFDANGNAILIDFDASTRLGSPLGLKNGGGGPKWARPGLSKEPATVENDVHSLVKLAESYGFSPTLAIRAIAPSPATQDSALAASTEVDSASALIASETGPSAPPCVVDQVAALNALFETLSAADKARSMGRANRLYNTERHDVVIGMTYALMCKLLAKSDGSPDSNVVPAQGA